MIYTLLSIIVTANVLLISAPSLGVIIVNIDSVCLSGCLSVCRTNFKLRLFLFLDVIEPVLAVSSPCGTLQNVVLKIFDLGPLTPKIYSLKFALAQNRL